MSDVNWAERLHEGLIQHGFHQAAILDLEEEAAEEEEAPQKVLGATEGFGVSDQDLKTLYRLLQQDPNARDKALVFAGGSYEVVHQGQMFLLNDKSVYAVNGRDAESHGVIATKTWTSLVVARHGATGKSANDLIRAFENFVRQLRGTGW